MGYQRLPQRLLKSLTMVTKAPVARFTHVVDAEISSQEFEEVQIQVPWGHISGKWYGPKNIRPIVGLHGWQDNAGTFDTLAPLLPSHVGFLSIDLPGHGLSSRLPDGMFYHGFDYLYVIRMIMKEYNWDKISLMAHSMCSITCFLFASIFPDKVDMVIGLDALKPHINPITRVPSALEYQIENFIIADERNRVQSEPPSYTYDELIEKLHAGTSSSVDKETCHYLLARNIQKSTKYPEKYFFTRDSRIKYYDAYSGSQELCVDLAKRIVAPYLFIKAINSSYYEKKKNFDEVLDVMKENPKFEFYEVEGTHHVHLNDPEKVSTIINNFINKYRPPEIRKMGYRNLPSLLRSFTMATKVPVARFTHAVDSDKPSPEFEEIQIKVPWGHISGKWYGPKNTRPIVGLHGWQDNAGTFDTLAPLLPSHVGFLSLDLPGHGLSSRLPDGIFYHGIDNLYLLRTIMKEYNWDKISLLAHSMCSIISFLFASIFPDKVDMVIGLDALKPHIRPDDKIPGSLKNRIENFIVADERNRVKSEPPSYTQEELIQKLHTGTGSSISRESCHYLLARNIQKSSKYPEKYFFTRDSRLKSSSYFSVPQELSLYLAKRIVIPYLFIKASNSSYYEDKKYFDEVIEVMKKNPKFEFYRVEGTHHVHLNEPEKISAIINPFINKYRPAEVVSSKL